MSPLGNAAAEHWANYCVVMFSDFTRKVTMQNLFHDGGFSSMGMSLRAMNQYAKDLTPYEDKNGKVIYGSYNPQYLLQADSDTASNKKSAFGER